MEDFICEVKWFIGHILDVPRKFRNTCICRKHSRKIANAIVEFYTNQSRRDYLHWEMEQYRAGNEHRKVELFEDTWLWIHSEDCMSSLVWQFDEDSYEHYYKVLPDVDDLHLSDWSRAWYVRKCKRNIRRILEAQQWICI